MSTVVPSFNYSQNAGLSSTLVNIPVVQTRAPTSTDSNPAKYPIGRIWINTAGQSMYVIVSNSNSSGSYSATWVGIGGGTVDVSTLTDTTGTTVTPTNGNIQIAGTANQITSTGGSSVITLSLPSAITAPGSLTTTTSLSAGTTITATLGNITATNGNLVLGTAGNKLSIATGSNASIGVTGAMSGTPGAVTVSTTACTTSSVILYSRATTGGTTGQVSITTQTNGSFTLTSTGNETSTFNYLIIN